MNTERPTEARQDELAGIIKKPPIIVPDNPHCFHQRDCPVVIEACVAQRDADHEYYLSLTVSRGGGVCKECDGCGKVWDSLSHHMDYPCPTCNGTGWKQPNTLGQASKVS